MPPKAFKPPRLSGGSTTTANKSNKTAPAAKRKSAISTSGVTKGKTGGRGGGLRGGRKQRGGSGTSRGHGHGSHGVRSDSSSGSGSGSGSPLVIESASEAGESVSEEGEEDEEDVEEVEEDFAAGRKSKSQGTNKDRSNGERTQKTMSHMDVDEAGEPEDDGEEEDGSGAGPPRAHIPTALLTRLLHEFFRTEGTRVGKEAGAAVGRYMETFVRESIARAAFARADAVAAGGMDGRGTGFDDGFLEVEDLEKLAPQLLLDF